MLAKKLFFKNKKMKKVKNFYTVGIDVGGTKISCCVGSFDNPEVLIESYDVTSPSGGFKVVEQVIENIQKLVPRTIIEKHLLKGIGIGIPGVVDFFSGRVVWAPNIKGWKNIPLGKIINSKFNVPVYVENDVDTAAVGEYYLGVNMKYKNMLFIAIGTGIGCGIIIDGKLYRGSHNVAGAIGWTILGKEGMNCQYKTCGHLEEIFSGSSFDKLAKKLFGEEINSTILFELYRKKNKKAIEVLDNALLYLGMAIANIISFFDPEVVVIGGGVGENTDIIIPKIKQVVKKYSQPYIANKVKILPSSLKNKAGLYGAMWLPVINQIKTKKEKLFQQLSEVYV
jgi:glucokinase